MDDFKRIIQDGAPWLGVFNLPSETFEEMNNYTRLIFYKTFNDKVDNLPPHKTCVVLLFQSK